MMCVVLCLFNILLGWGIVYGMMDDVCSDDSIVVDIVWIFLCCISDVFV